MSESRTTDLVGRLRAHARLHEDLANMSAEQAQWGKDLREAADEIERLRQENRLLKAGFGAALSWVHSGVHDDVTAKEMPDTSLYSDIYKIQLADLRIAKGLL